ncbi:MAG: LysM peptidoglycan-binding domain-containing protein [Candidatus Promineofilum sp.]|nr:LysM peptidoglycan-binding domain-containing protein [Promineifilum sp.]
MKHLNRIAGMLLLPLLLLFAAGVVRADTAYVIQPGDSLFRIALQFGVTVDDIVQANNIVNPNLIIAGQELVIPGVDGPAQGQPVPPPAATVTAGTTPPVTGGTAVEGGVIHVIQPGESLFRISLLYNVPMADIVAANELANASLIIAGQELFIPGATAATAPAAGAPAAGAPAAGTTTGGAAPTAAAPGPVAPAATLAPTPPPAVAATNLFINPSFEGDWHYHIYNELQIPDGWQVAIDEGPNTLQPGDGGNFARPEIRVVSRAQLAESEWDWFIFDGFKTLKAFKGYAPTIFHFFQDVPLQPGRYRMTINFFPDIVAQYYPGGRRDFHTDPLSGEVRIIHDNGGTDWSTVTPGQKNSRTYEFTVGQASTVRLGASFRNRFGPANNGWFLDNWQLQRLGN